VSYFSLDSADVVVIGMLRHLTERGLASDALSLLRSQDVGAAAYDLYTKIVDI